MAQMDMPEIGGETWLNSPPLLKRDIAGKVVMVSFWTYTSMRSLRDLRYIKRWWRDYRDDGLVLIGIHSPEFDFARDPDTVAAMVRELDITWPVVLDNDLTIWERFAAPVCPVELLVNREGRIVYTRSGEGEFLKTEDNIRRLLRLEARDASFGFMDSHEQAQGGICFVPTPDLYCGYEKGAISNHGGYVQDQENEYVAAESLEGGSIALSGRFTAAPQYVETAEDGAAIHLSFNATEVNLVVRPLGGEARVSVAFEGEAMGEDLRGRDVSESGEVSADKPFVYNLLLCDDPVAGTLTVAAERSRFQAYVFTFSGCVD